MCAKGHLDLTDFMPESLMVPVNATAPGRELYVRPKHFYEDFLNQDPCKVLGQVDFCVQPKVPEGVKGSNIQEFFRNSNVFVTGGTGFLGKVLIEKLIRSIPNLKHVYVLIRPKRGKTVKDRFDKLMVDQVFLRMQTEVPEYLNKITVVEGDISQPDLGLSAEDRKLLIDNVDVVFNSAADVRFKEPLKKTMESNVFGTKRMLELCKEMHKLKAFVHVSTAYSHCVRDFIDEKVYKVYINYKEVMAILERTPDSEIDNVTRRLIQDWPNTYTFGKALCEQMIAEEKENLPICIVRPSIVLPSYKEPVRGWCDNLYGPMGLTVGVGLGVLHAAPTELEPSADFVPVDFTSNFIFAAAWKTGSQTQHEEVTVYNFSATSVRPTCWKDIINYLLSLTEIYPFHQSIWYCSYMNTNPYIYNIVHHTFHTIPGLVLDRLAVMLGKEARLSKVYSKVLSMKDQNVYFTSNVWRWKSDNVWKIWNEMSKEDKELFEFDLASIDFKEHLLVCKLGIRYFFLKEKMESLPAALKKNNKLFWIHRVVQLIFGVTALKLMAMVSHHLPI